MISKEIKNKIIDWFYGIDRHFYKEFADKNYRTVVEQLKVDIELFKNIKSDNTIDKEKRDFANEKIIIYSEIIKCELDDDYLYSFLKE